MRIYADDVLKKEAQDPISKDGVIEWFKSNPNPSDEELHEWAEDMGWEAHDLETMVYEIVTDYVASMDE